MILGFYNEVDALQADGVTDVDFGFLENVRVGEAYNLYDFLHGNCDAFAAALSDYFGYEIEYVVSSDGMLIHAYCVQELENGELAYIDARGMTVDETLFFYEFRDWIDYDKDSDRLFGLKGLCQVVRCENAKEMYASEDWDRTVDEELLQFLKSYRDYYDVRVLEKEQEKTADRVKRLKEFESGVLAQMEASGLDVAQMDVHVMKFIDEKHQDCLWFGGQVALIWYKEHLFSLEAKGFVVASLFTDCNNMVQHVRDFDDMGGFFQGFREFLADDDALYAALQEGSLNLVNKNLFEIYTMGPDGMWLNETWVSSSDNLKESLVDMAKMMDDILVEVGFQKPLGETLDAAKEKCEKAGCVQPSAAKTLGLQADGYRMME